MALALLVAGAALIAVSSRGRPPTTRFVNDQITFRALLRTDGKRVDLTAVKAYRNGAS